MRSLTSCLPRSVLRLTVTLFLLRLGFTKSGCVFQRLGLVPPRWPSPRRRDSIFSTSAPYSPRHLATTGPAAPVHSSTTRMPSSGRLLTVKLLGSHAEPP